MDSRSLQLYKLISIKTEEVKAGYNIHRQATEKYDQRGSYSHRKMVLAVLNQYRKHIENITDLAYKWNEFTVAEMCEDIMKECSAPKFTWIDKFKDESYYTKFEKIFSKIDEVINHYSKVIK